MIAPIAAGAITLYQRHLSPHKGFSGPYRLLHGGESCSGYVKRLILEKGLVTAIQASRERFAACRDARYVLSASLDDDLGDACCDVVGYCFEPLFP